MTKLPETCYGARGREPTTDTTIFSRMLYQLSYPVMGFARPVGLLASCGYRQCFSSCPEALSPPIERLILVIPIAVGGAVGGLVDGHAIAFIEPAIKVAIAAATAAKRLVRLVARQIGRAHV